MDLKKAQEYIKALKNGEKFPKKNMFLIMFLLGALLFVIVLRPVPLPRLRKKADQMKIKEKKIKIHKRENMKHTQKKKHLPCCRR